MFFIMITVIMFELQNQADQVVKIIVQRTGNTIGLLHIEVGQAKQ